MFEVKFLRHNKEKYRSNVSQEYSFKKTFNSTLDWTPSIAKFAFWATREKIPKTKNVINTVIVDAKLIVLFLLKLLNASLIK